MPKTGNVRNGNRSNKTIRVRWIDIMINKKVARFFLLCILISISHSFNGCKKADEKSKAVKPYPKREVEHTYTSTVFISFDLEESLDSRAAYEFIEALEKVTMRDMVIPQGLNLIDLSIVDVSRDHLSWDSILETEDSFYKYKSRLKRNAEGIIISFRLKIIIDTECVPGYRQIGLQIHPYGGKKTDIWQKEPFSVNEEDFIVPKTEIKPYFVGSNDEPITVTILSLKVE